MRLTDIGSGLLLVLLLSACGGGGGDSPAPNTANAQMLEINVGTTAGQTDTVLTGTGDTGTDRAVYETPEGIAQCSVDDIKSRVDFDMRDYYIYYDQVPALNLDQYDSANELINDLRVDPDKFSSVRDAATQTSLFSQGRTQGYGFGIKPSSDDVVRFKNVDIGSPGFNAGILRGDEVISFNGQPVSNYSDGEIKEILESTSIDTVTMRIRTGDEEARTVDVTRQEYRWVTAAALTRFTPPPDTSLPVIGYLAIDVFLATTRDEIDAALQVLEDDGGFDELIIDLRYNRGGLTSVAQYLAAVVGGEAVEGQVLLENQWNDKYTAFNSTEFFEKVEKPLNSPRVFVLTTGSTASSSEIFINSLKPYIDVVIIGGVTGGKPFTAIPRSYCGKSINAMAALRVNSVGVSVLDGIQPDCQIDDDWNTLAQSAEDPLVAGALSYAIQGGCPVNVLADNGGLQRKLPAGPTYQPKVLVDFAIADY